MNLRAASSCVLPVVLTAAALVAQSGQSVNYTVGGVDVTRWVDPTGPRATWSRNGGAPMSLLNPDDRLYFVLQSFDPLVGVPTFSAPLGVPAGTRLRLVQFHTQILGPYRDAVEAAGAEILHYMPANALFVRCDANVAAALQALPCVRWVGDLPNALKLDAALRAFLVTGGAPPAECNLVLAAKSDRPALLAAIAQWQGQVVDPCYGSVMVRARLSPAQLGNLLATDLITWADLAGADGQDMDNARIVGGANAVETAGGFVGQGVRVDVTESFDETHQDVVGRVLVRGTNLAANHGQCVSGIVGGNGTGNWVARGMLPACDLIEGAYVSTNHYSQILDSVNPVLPWHVMIATASWGAVESLDYNAVTQNIDDALFDSDLCRLNSQGNNGSQLSRPEAWAKNMISVGGVKHYDDANSANDAWNLPGDTVAASIGPAADGRIKPDIVSFFDAVTTTDRPGALGYSLNDYIVGFGGTSAATPIVAGHVGLLMQMFTDGLFGNPLPQPALASNRFANKPHMTTSKALLCNTAEQYPFAGLAHDLTRTHQGWGRPNVERAYTNRDKIVVLDEYDTLTLGQVREYWVQVAPGTPEFRATLVWADPAAQANASVHLVNDANLKVVRDADGVFWWGNHGLADGTASVSGGLPDDRNTIENVYLPNPAPGTYRIRVEAASIVQDGKPETPALDMDFALVFHPAAGGFHAAGGLHIDLQSAAPGDLRMHCSSVPASGWNQGFTAWSLTTNRGPGFGRFFGLEDDAITGALWAFPAFPDNPFHFPNLAGTYPFVDYTVPSWIPTAFAGWQLDAMLVLFSDTAVVAVSNVDRITLQ